MQKGAKLAIAAGPRPAIGGLASARRRPGARCLTNWAVDRPDSRLRPIRHADLSQERTCPDRPRS